MDHFVIHRLDPKQKTDSGLYNMSGGTGSRRFMAPEVSLSEPYSLSADLYSFAILLWELLTLKKAFAYLPVEEHRELVVRNDNRPDIDPTWSPGMIDLIERCWARSPFDRPAAKDVYKAIRNEIQEIYHNRFAPEEEYRKSA